MEKEFITIEDTTLREGEQTPGIALTPKQKSKIVEALIGLGIQYAEIGIPVMGSLEYESIEQMNREFGSDITLIGWNRGIREDLVSSFNAGLKAIHIGLPSSAIHVEKKFNQSFSWVLDTACDLIAFAKEQGATFISVSAEDMGRADIDFLVQYAKTVWAAGATRLRLSDTIGCLTPGKIFSVVQRLRKETPIPLQMHMHNDFNLALANTLSGIEAGASQVHATVNGLGERAGITALHQIAIALEVLYNRSTGIKMEGLYKTSRLVAEYTKKNLSANEPLIGEDVFSHESGIHVDGMLKLKESFEAFDPAAIGRSHTFVLGKHSGSHAIQYFLEQMGIHASREEAGGLLPFVREFAIINGGSFSPEVLKLFWDQMHSSKLEMKV